MKIKTLALIIIVIIVLVGGFFVYKQLNTPKVAIQEMGEVESDSKNNSLKVLSAIEEFTYVSIPELGVKLAIQKGIQDFKYVIKDEKVSFTRVSFEAKSSYCLAKDSPFGTLTKVLKKNLTNDSNGYWATTFKGMANAVKEGYAKDFGDFYLIYITPSDPSCAVAVQAKGKMFSLENTKAL